MYTSGVTKVVDKIDGGAFQVSSNAVLLSEYTGDAILERIENKIDNDGN